MYEERTENLVATVVNEVTFAKALPEAEKYKYAREVVDRLIGSDETAIVRGVGPVGEGLVEQLSDMLTTLIVAQLTKA
jgi:hypothetical protein